MTLLYFWFLSLLCFLLGLVSHNGHARLAGQNIVGSMFYQFYKFYQANNLLCRNSSKIKSLEIENEILDNEIDEAKEDSLIL